MKIDNDGTRPLGNATADPLAKTTGAQGGAGKPRTVTGGSDALKLSPEARLLQAAADQTLGPPAIRKACLARSRRQPQRSWGQPPVTGCDATENGLASCSLDSALVDSSRSWSDLRGRVCGR